MTKRERILLGITGKEYKDINAIAAEMKPMPTPCELAEENDRLMQKVSALCKERDELKRDNERLRRALDQTVVKLNDETVRAERVEAENYSKEQYIAETIGKLARERKRDDEIIASLQKELVEAAKERDAAIADISSLALKQKFTLCDCCKNKNSLKCVYCRGYLFTKPKFEWRGVQEREER